MYCPNCGQKVRGYKSKDGAVRIDCPRCKIKIFSKQKNRKKVSMELTVSEGNG